MNYERTAPFETGGMNTRPRSSKNKRNYNTYSPTALDQKGRRRVSLPQQQQQHHHHSQQRQPQHRRRDTLGGNMRGSSIERKEFGGERQQQEINELKARKIKNKIRSFSNKQQQQLRHQHGFQRHAPHAHPMMSRKNSSKSSNNLQNPRGIHMLSRPTRNSMGDAQQLQMHSKARRISSMEQQMSLAQRKNSSQQAQLQQGQQRRHMDANEKNNDEWYLDTTSILPSKDGIKR